MKPETRLPRWIVYQDDGTAFVRVSGSSWIRADNAKEALSMFLETYEDHLSDGMRFAVRQNSMRGDIFLFKLQTPKRTFSIVGV